MATLVGDDIVRDQISLSETQRPWRELTVRWGRNYSTLSTIAGAVEQNDPAEAARLRREWSESTATQSIPEYPYAEQITRDTYIADAGDAATHRDSLLGFRVTRRDVWSIETFLPRISVGDTIRVESAPLSGATGRVIAVSQSPTRGTSTLEVWV